MQVFNYSNDLTSAQIQQLYRIVQEALANIIKHAEASQADIQVFGYPTMVDIVIEDNGNGFHTGATNGLGLNQMKIRAETIKGKIEINSYPGKGTIVLVEVPLTN